MFCREAKEYYIRLINTEKEYYIRPINDEPHVQVRLARVFGGAPFDIHYLKIAVRPIECFHIAHEQHEIVVDLSGTLWETPHPEYDRKFTTLRHDFVGNIETEYEWIRTHLHVSLDEHYQEGLKRALALFVSRIQFEKTRAKVCIFVGSFNEQLVHYIWVHVEALIPDGHPPPIFQSQTVDPDVRYTTNDTYGITSFGTKPSMFTRIGNWFKVAKVVPEFHENVRTTQHTQHEIVVDLSGTLWETPHPEYDRKFTTLRHDFVGNIETEYEWIRTHLHVSLDEHHQEGLKRALALFVSRIQFEKTRAKVCIFVGTFNEQLVHYIWVHVETIIPCE